MSIKITLEDGKYLYERTDDHNQYILRYNEPWRDLSGDNFVAAMANRIVELEKNQIPEGSHVIRGEDLYGLMEQNEMLCKALDQSIKLLATTLHETLGDSFIHLGSGINQCSDDDDD